jgi:hypothetical protein
MTDLALDALRQVALPGCVLDQDYAEWRAILDAAGLIFGIVADAQILASEALVRLKMAAR